MKKTALFVVIILTMLFIPGGCNSDSNREKEVLYQSPDLDLETAGLENWKTGGEGYEITLDKKNASSGKQSLRIQCVGEPFLVDPAFAALTLPVQQFRGKRICLSADLKTEKSEKPFQLWIRADKGIDPLQVKDMQGRGPKGSAPWKRYSIEMDIPSKTTLVSVGVVMTGKGTGWIDNLQIKLLPLKRVKPVHISGKVLDKKGKTVAGAVVSLNWTFAIQAVEITRTDKKGAFSFTRPRGFYELTAIAPGLGFGSIDSTGYHEDKSGLELKLANKGLLLQGSVTFKRKNSEGKNNDEKDGKENGDVPENTYVTAIYNGSNYTKLFACPVKADGSFRMRIPEGIYTTVSVQSPGMISHLKSIKKNQQEDASPSGSLKLEAVENLPAADSVVEWIKRKARPITTAKAGNGFDDLMPLKKIIGNARVVGLGESTHGTREIFQMKHRMLEFLVTQMGFTVFALEGSWGEVLAVNQYVLHGKGDPARALAGVMFWTWNTEEVLDMIHWIRKYNLDPAHKKKVKFYGVDIQYTKESIRLLSDYLKKTGPKCLTQLLHSLILLGQENAYFKLPKLPEAERSKLMKSFDQALEQFDKNKEMYIALSSRSQWRENRHHVRVLQQFAEMATADVTSIFSSYEIRDKSMAENTLWILENEPQGTKVVLWAHNGHIQEVKEFGNTKMLGYHLNQSLGNRYFTIGFVMNRGSFQARDYTAPFYPLLLREVPLSPAPAGSYGEAMARAGLAVFFLDLRKVSTGDGVRAWFQAPHLLRGAGALYMGQESLHYVSPLIGTFDSVIFMDKTSRARPNKLGRRPTYPY